jgi:hypothetical protein
LFAVIQQKKAFGKARTLGLHRRLLDLEPHPATAAVLHGVIAVRNRDNARIRARVSGSIENHRIR